MLSSRIYALCLRCHRYTTVFRGSKDVGTAVAPRADYPPHPHLGLCLLVWISCLRLSVVVDRLVHFQGVSELSKLHC